MNLESYTDNILTLSMNVRTEDGKSVDFVRECYINTPSPCRRDLEAAKSFVEPEINSGRYVTIEGVRDEGVWPDSHWPQRITREDGSEYYW